jgi:hypothetical protein
MRQRYWLSAAAAVLGAGLLAIPAQAAPAGALGTDVRAGVGDASTVQQAHYWGRRHYRGYYYGPRRYYGNYGYHRPYRSYGYGPGYGFYSGPRYYGRGWW